MKAHPTIVVTAELCTSMWKLSCSFDIFQPECGQASSRRPACDSVMHLACDAGYRTSLGLTLPWQYINRLHGSCARTISVQVCVFVKLTSCSFTLLDNRSKRSWKEGDSPKLLRSGVISELCERESESIGWLDAGWNERNLWQRNIQLSRARDSLLVSSAQTGGLK